MCNIYLRTLLVNFEALVYSLCFFCPFTRYLRFCLHLIICQLCSPLVYHQVLLWTVALQRPQSYQYPFMIDEQTVSSIWQQYTIHTASTSFNHSFDHRKSENIACSRRSDGGERVKSYAASAKRNTREKNEGRPLPPYFFPRQVFTHAQLIFRFCHSF